MRALIRSRARELRRRAIAALAFAFAWMSLPQLALAEERAPDSLAEPDAPRGDAKTEAPTTAYAYTAHGASTGSFGAQAYGLGLTGNRDVTLGGGAVLWGAPVRRLTLVGDFGRDLLGRFAPSAAGIVRIVGRADDGFSLGLLGKFKVDGFAVGPTNELESEVETGLLVSYARRGFHLDVNAISGFGLGDDGEIDGEARLRFGYDLHPHVRLGFDGQARYRLSGTYRLPGNRLGDVVFGPQTIVGTRRFFGAFTAGPSTMGIVDGDRAFGWAGVISVGGTN